MRTSSRTDRSRIFVLVYLHCMQSVEAECNEKSIKKSKFSVRRPIERLRSFSYRDASVSQSENVDRFVPRTTPPRHDSCHRDRHCHRSPLTTATATATVTTKNTKTTSSRNRRNPTTITRRERSVSSNGTATSAPSPLSSHARKRLGEAVIHRFTRDFDTVTRVWAYTVRACSHVGEPRGPNRVGSDSLTPPTIDRVYDVCVVARF